MFFLHSPGLDVMFSYNILYRSFFFMSATTINDVSFKAHLIIEIAVNLLEYSDYLCVSCLLVFLSFFSHAFHVMWLLHFVAKWIAHCSSSFSLDSQCAYNCSSLPRADIGVAHKRLNSSYVWLGQWIYFHPCNLVCLLQWHLNSELLD